MTGSSRTWTASPQALDHYLKCPTWFSSTYTDEADARIAYFSAEFGIHESVPVYSGGLGVLAGDHLKSASDLGIPLVGVSLMYREGYFRQYLNAEGWQQERYPENDFFTLPLIPELDSAGKPLIVDRAAARPRRAACASGTSRSGGCRCICSTRTSRRTGPRTGRSRRSCMAATRTRASSRRSSSASAASARSSCSGKVPTVCHMNEGHAAFTVLERIRHPDGGAQARLRLGAGRR